MHEALIHQLHEEDRSVAGGILHHTQELDDAVTTSTSNCSWVIMFEEDGVKDYSSTGELIK